MLRDVLRNRMGFVQVLTEVPTFSAFTISSEEHPDLGRHECIRVMPATHEEDVTNTQSCDIKASWWGYGHNAAAIDLELECS